MDHFIADDGQRIHVSVTGAGPPLVLLHEWASSHQVWRPVAKRLEHGFRVFAWDARGHGGHALEGQDAVTVGRMARDLAKLLDHYRLDRPVVVGHSMGALTLWEYIGRYGCTRLGRLCIVDQSPRLITDADWRLGINGDWPADRDAQFVQNMETDFVETVVKLVALGKNERARRRFLDPKDGLWRLRAYLETLEPAPLIQIWRSLAAADYRPVLPTIDVPTLLVYATESNYYGVETGEYVRRSIPDARLEVYDGADHLPHVADPERFARDLRTFAGVAAG